MAYLFFTVLAKFTSLLIKIFNIASLEFKFAVTVFFTSSFQMKSYYSNIFPGEMGL